MFKQKGDVAVLAKLGDAPAPFSEIGQRLHRIISASGPGLEPVLGNCVLRQEWRGHLLHQTGKELLVFGVAEGLNPALEDGANMHPVAWTVTSMDAATEEKIVLA